MKTRRDYNVVVTYRIYYKFIYRLDDEFVIIIVCNKDEFVINSKCYYNIIVSSCFHSNFEFQDITLIRSMFCVIYISVMVLRKPMNNIFFSYFPLVHEYLIFLGFVAENFQQLSNYYNGYGVFVTLCNVNDLIFGV